MVLSVFNSNAQSTFYAVSPSNADLVTMDSTTMLQTATIAMTSATGTVSGANGLAEACGSIYIIYQAAGSRYLGTIDPATGVITEVGDLGDNVANITFANGVLLGVTGDGAGVAETLFSINTTTAAMTLLTPLGNGNDGESIEFNPDDGLLYHWSGWGAPITMESINPFTSVITPITLSGGVLENVGASTYIGNNEFLISDVNNGGLKYVTTTGVVTLTSNTTDTFKGMVFADNASVTNTTAANDSICLGDTAVLVCNNTGATYEWFFDGTSTGNTNDTLNATVAGAYVCAIDNGTCILTSDTIHLTVSNLPTTNLSPSPSAAICDGDTLELSLNTGGGPASFQWYMSGTMIAGETNSSYFATMAGSYNATKTNQNGCSDSSAVATVITVNPLPTTNITPSPTVDVCDGDSVELMVNTGGGGGGTIQWSLNGSPIAGATNASYFVSTAGSYNVTKTNMNGCSAESAIPTTVNVNTLPSVSLTPSGAINFCTGDSVEISISTGAGNGTFQWYLEGSVISGATNPTYFATSEGSYNLEKTNINNCTDSAAIATMLVDTCNIGLFELSDLSFDIYPNPASDFVTIDFDSFTNTDITELQLTSIDGKTVRVLNINDAHSNLMSINISDVNTGIYFIRMTTSYGQIVKELIIE